MRQIRTRIRLALALLRLGAFVKSLALVVMKPSDLIQFSRRSYATSSSIDSWTRRRRVDSGLTPLEEDAVRRIPFRECRLLLLGLGGGREALALARLGFEVTGVDYVPEMAAKAAMYAAEEGLRIAVVTEEVSTLEIRGECYEIVWLSTAMYSAIPGRARRIRLLKRLARALVPGGYLVCSFSYNASPQRPGAGGLLRRVFAVLTLGNLQYQEGDRLHGNEEFLHDFLSESELQTEFRLGGFEIIHVVTTAQAEWPMALLRKVLMHGVC